MRRDGPFLSARPLTHFADLAQAIGAAVHLQRRLRVDLTGFDLEVVAFLLQGELLVGINLISGKSMECNPLSASNDL